MQMSLKEVSNSKVWQARRRKIQNEIVAQAMDLFDAKGYEATTVDNIASASLISSRTFYRYFPAKEDLVFHGFPDSVELLRREVRMSRGRLLNRLRHASVTLSQVLESDRQAWIRRFNLILSVPSLRARDIIVNERYEEVFREVILEEWPDTIEMRQKSQLLAGAIMGGIQTAIKMWVRGHGSPSLPILANSVFDTLEPVGVPLADTSQQHYGQEKPAPIKKRRRSQNGNWDSWMNQEE